MIDVHKSDTQEDAVESTAEELWNADYPNGGSMYRTWKSTPYHDKELYRQEAKVKLADHHKKI